MNDYKTFDAVSTNGNRDGNFDIDSKIRRKAFTLIVILFMLVLSISVILWNKTSSSRLRSKPKQNKLMEQFLTSRANDKNQNISLVEMYEQAEQNGEEIMNECMTSDAYRVISKFFQAYHDYQEYGSISTSHFITTMSSLVTKHVKINDTSNPNEFKENGVFHGHKGLKLWIGLVSFKDKTDIFTNVQTHLSKHKNKKFTTTSGKVIFQDQVIRIKTDSDVVSEQKSLEMLVNDTVNDIHYHGPNLTFTAIRNLNGGQLKVEFTSILSKLYSCLISSIEMERTFGGQQDEQISVDRSNSGVSIQTEFESGENQSSIVSERMRKISASHEVLRKQQWILQKQNLYKRDSKIKNKQLLKCVKHIESRLRFQDGSMKNINKYLNVDDNVRIHFAGEQNNNMKISLKLNKLEDAKLKSKLQDVIIKLRQNKVEVHSDIKGSNILLKNKNNDVVVVSSNSCEVNDIYLSYKNKQIHPVIKHNFDFAIDPTAYLIVTGSFLPLDTEWFSQTASFNLPYAFDYWIGILHEVRPNWKIKTMSIPGTHDSGAAGYYGWLPVGVNLQTKPLSVQLNLGIRLFDIRFGWSGSNYEIYHGMHHVGLSLHEVIYTFVLFLAHHPNEFIVVNLQTASGHSNWDYMDVFKFYDVIYGGIGHSWKIFFLDTYHYDPTISDVKGKIVISCSGGAWGTYPKLQSIRGQVNKFTLSTGPYGEQTDPNSYSQKLWLRVYYNCHYGSYLDEVTQWNGFCYNCFSWNPTQLPHVFPMNFAYEVNYYMWANFFQNGPNYCPHNVGWNWMDFPGDKLIEKILLENFARNFY